MIVKLMGWMISITKIKENRKKAVYCENCKNCVGADKYALYCGIKGIFEPKHVYFTIPRFCDEYDPIREEEKK